MTSDIRLPLPRVARPARLAILGLAASAALFLSAEAARANYFNATDWSSGGPGSTSVVTSPGSVVLSYNFSPGYCAGCGHPTWTFSTTATSTGVLGFNWAQNANYAYFQSSGYLTFSDTTSGTTDTLNTDSGPFSATGTGSLAVVAGDNLVFQAHASNFDSQGFVDGTVRLTQFTGVAEPTSLALLGVGLLGFAVARRRTA